MGGRKGYSANVVIGGGGVAKASVNSIQASLKGQPSQTVVDVAIAAVAVSNPALGKVIMTGRMLMWSYELYKQSYEEYQSTGSYTAALSSAAGTTVEKGIRIKKNEIIGAAVSKGWATLKQSSGITTNGNVDQLVTDIASQVIEENLT